MDPNSNLSEQLHIARDILADKEERTYGAIRLAELVQALDSWLSMGGFLPDLWKPDQGRS